MMTKTTTTTTAETNTALWSLPKVSAAKRLLKSRRKEKKGTINPSEAPSTEELSDEIASNAAAPLSERIQPISESAADSDVDSPESEQKDGENGKKTRWSSGSLGRIRRFAGRIVEDSWFQLFIVLLILVNGIMMGIATFDFVSTNPRTSRAFEQTDQAFLIIFTIELVLQFAYHGLQLFLDGWLLFDFVIVLMSWSLDSFQIVRTFRIFRAFRMVTRVKILRDLVSSLLAVGPRMTALSALLGVIFYIYGVLCTILFGDLYERGLTDNDYFSRLDLSCWTLFVMMTLEFAEVSRQVMDVYSASFVLFVSFVLITSFIGYNLMIAIVCDSVAVIEHGEEMEEKKEEEEEEMMDRARRVENLTARVNKMASEQQRILAQLQSAMEKASSNDGVVA